MWYYFSLNKMDGGPPEDLMKLLFNPYKNVGVYLENMRRTFFLQIFNEKRERLSAELRNVISFTKSISFKPNSTP